ncbi:MAG: tRNA (adenosine(37)-N6)-threonylcarbamoyltransferase complex ATPase subunit type 1 TsaE, partial [Patescibacteria group bacterium]
DCYRLKNEKDAIMLGLPEIFKNSENLLLIEWPERIKKALPKKIITVKFSHIDETTRKVSFN